MTTSIPLHVRGSSEMPMRVRPNVGFWGGSSRTAFRVRASSTFTACTTSANSGGGGQHRRITEEEESRRWQQQVVPVVSLANDESVEEEGVEAEV